MELNAQLGYDADVKNCDAVVFSSQTSRTDAREFYKRLGYEVSSTSNVFLKGLV